MHNKPCQAFRTVSNRLVHILIHQRNCIDLFVFCIVRRALLEGAGRHSTSEQASITENGLHCKETLFGHGSFFVFGICVFISDVILRRWPDLERVNSCTLEDLSV